MHFGLIKRVTFNSCIAGLHYVCSTARPYVSIPHGTDLSVQLVLIIHDFVTFCYAFANLTWTSDAPLPTRADTI